jgi:hypothetical protein
LANQPPPDETTVPHPSNPGTTGSLGGELYFPEQYRTSDGFTGEQITLTRISPRRGVGTGISTTRIPAGPENSSSMAARIFMAQTLREREMLTAVENGNTGSSKMVTLGGFDLP